MDLGGARLISGGDCEHREATLLAVLSICPIKWEPLSEALAYIQDGCWCSEEEAFALWKQFVDHGVVSARADRKALDAYEIACSERLPDRRNDLFLMNAFRCVADVESNIAELRAAMPVPAFPNTPKKKAAAGRAPAEREMCRALFDEHPILLDLRGKQLFRNVEALLKEKFPAIVVPSPATIRRARDKALADRSR